MPLCVRWAKRPLVNTKPQSPPITSLSVSIDVESVLTPSRQNPCCFLFPKILQSWNPRPESLPRLVIYLVWVYTIVRSSAGLSAPAYQVSCQYSSACLYWWAGCKSMTCFLCFFLQYGSSQKKSNRPAGYMYVLHAKGAPVARLLLAWLANTGHWQQASPLIAILSGTVQARLVACGLPAENFLTHGNCLLDPVDSQEIAK